MYIVTQQSVEKKQAELQMTKDLLKKAKTDLSLAREEGDLRENFAYQEGKKEVARLSKIFEEKSSEFNNPALEIVDPMQWTKLDMEGYPRAMIGCKVTIQRKNQQPETYLIGGAWDDQEGVLPYTSPLAKSLIPKAEGTIIDFQVEEETQEIQLLKAEPPQEALLKTLYLKKPSKPTKQKPEMLEPNME